MKKYDYIIIGAGASGLMMAYNMAIDSYFDNSSILILDNLKDKGNDRTWSFWEEDTGPWDDILYKSWSKIYFGSKWYSQTIATSNYKYKTIRSKDFYSKVWSTIGKRPNIKFEEDKIELLQEHINEVKVKGKNRSYKAKRVFNSSVLNLEFKTQKKYPLLNQHFLGWFVKTEGPCFDDSVATFMDFNIPQNGNTRFMYVLPFNKQEALFEYTLFSKTLLDKSEYEDEIASYLSEKGITDYKILEKEFGVIPMTSYKFHKRNSKNIIHIGTIGGWTKASTGFTFMNTTEKTKKLTAFVKTCNDFRQFHKPTKFWFYDLIFLDVLAADNAFGAKLFSSLFKKTPLRTVFRFLDQKSNFLEDLKIIASVPPGRFISAFFKRLF